MRQRFGHCFGIVVVAFPEGDLSGNESFDVAAAWSSARRDTKLLFLKKKLSAGADYIVTQGIFDVDVFDQRCSYWRRHDIRCSIFPSVLPGSQVCQLK